MGSGDGEFVEGSRIQLSFRFQCSLSKGVRLLSFPMVSQTENSKVFSLGSDIM